MADLYEGPARDMGSTKSKPSNAAQLNGDPLDGTVPKRTPSPNAKDEVIFYDYGVFKNR